MREFDQLVECVGVDQRHVLILLQVPVESSLIIERACKKRTQLTRSEAQSAN
jgi:hypothetical protein